MKGFFLAITAGILAMFLVVAPAYAVTVSMPTPQRGRPSLEGVG